MKTRLQLLVLLCLLVIAPAMRGQEADDRQQYGRDIIVRVGETAGDLLCYYCSIQVRGTVNGDAVGGPVGRIQGPKGKRLSRIARQAIETPRRGARWIFPPS